MPEKPVSDFEVSDTVVCAHVPLLFDNNSSREQQHPTRAQQWVWTFGDGETYTTDTAEAVSHAYANAGVYSVSLHYYNGYCDSTLVKNQYIRVVEAPAPGFEVDNNRGCSPFGLTVTDTITEFVRKKEYNYYDGTGWHEVAKDDPQILMNYPHAGNYWVVQRLYGYTGCITQQDSVRVYVTPGVTLADTIHTQRGSYLQHTSTDGAWKINYRGDGYWQGAPEQIELEWTSHAAAVSYHIHRDGIKIAKVDSPRLVYHDEIGIPRVVEYRVTGEDSCGHETSWGRSARPIKLDGENTDNEIAIITFSPYGETVEEIEYQVYVEQDGAWEVLSEVGKREEYKDMDYAQRTSEQMIEKCYVVSDVAGAIWSNVVCLAYQPTVFVPTGFTPNGVGVNDVNHIQTYGIANYEVEVYNRYGQKITSFTQEDNGWDGEDAPMGAYLIRVRARDIEGKWYDTKQTVSVVR
ncbi:MAG: gliding motility-associated C-terminal domain-containing protein [Bacteroidia bacterium]|nr:gliding motility-associated C-terminal domain-containing protein [Bacteroidia bacterium]